MDIIKAEASQHRGLREFFALTGTQDWVDDILIYAIPHASTCELPQMVESTPLPRKQKLEVDEAIKFQNSSDYFLLQDSTF